MEDEEEEWGRSETSSATLPVTWSCESLDQRSVPPLPQSSTSPSPSLSPLSLSSPTPAAPARGPVLLLGADFAPQVMTEECQPSYSSSSPSSRPTSSHPSSNSITSSHLYSTFLPDSAVAHLPPCLEQREEVSIVCNQFTCIETDPSMEEETEEETEEEVEAFKEEVVSSKRKGWGSNSGLQPLMSFWERRGNAEVMKYASESHLADDRVPENGLRRQVREKDFTSGESSAEEGWEEHIYARIEEPRTALVEESGFFSHEEPREEILGSEEDEFVLVGGRAEPRHIQRLTVGGEERHVTRIQVQAFQPGFRAVEEKRRKEEAEEEARRNVEEREKRQLEKELLRVEEEEERIYKEKQLIRKEEGRRQKKEEEMRKGEEDWPRQSVRDLRALYERVGCLH